MVGERKIESEKGKIYIYLYIFLKGGREQPNQQTNLPMIINSKY